MKPFHVCWCLLTCHLFEYLATHYKPISPNFTRLSSLIMIPVRFINPGSLADWLPNKGSARADNAQLMGRPKYQNDRPGGRSNHRPKGLAEEERRPFTDSGPPLQPERLLRPPAYLRTVSPTGVLPLISSPPSDGLSDRKAWPRHYF